MTAAMFEDLFGLYTYEEIQHLQNDVVEGDALPYHVFEANDEHGAEEVIEDPGMEIVPYVEPIIQLHDGHVVFNAIPLQVIPADEWYYNGADNNDADDNNGAEESSDDSDDDNDGAAGADESSDDENNGAANEYQGWNVHGLRFHEGMFFLFLFLE